MNIERRIQKFFDEMEIYLSLFIPSLIGFTIIRDKENDLLRSTRQVTMKKQTLTIQIKRK